MSLFEFHLTPNIALIAPHRYDIYKRESICGIGNECSVIFTYMTVCRGDDNFVNYVFFLSQLLKVRKSQKNNFFITALLEAKAENCKKNRGFFLVFEDDKKFFWDLLTFTIKGFVSNFVILLRVINFFLEIKVHPAQLCIIFCPISSLR